MSLGTKTQGQDQPYSPILECISQEAQQTTHARNPEDLIGWICPFDRSSRLDLSISSGITDQSKMSVGLVCLFHLTLWKKENFSLLVPNGAYLGSNEVTPDGLYVCLGQSKGLEFGNVKWREAPPHISHLRLNHDDNTLD